MAVYDQTYWISAAFVEEYLCLCQKYIYLVSLDIFLIISLSVFSSSKHCFCFELHMEDGVNLEIVFKKA